MRHARLLIALLLLATVLVDLVALARVVSDERSPHELADPDLLLLTALAFAQSSLAAVWAGFGGRSIAWRLMGLVLVAAIWSGVAAWLIRPSSRKDLEELTTVWSILLLAQTFLVFSSVMIARLSGVRLVGAREVDSPAPEAADRPRLQFSLAFALSWITAVAVVLSIVQCTVSREAIPWDPDFWWKMAMLSAAHASIALFTLWTVLGVRGLALRIVLLSVTTLAAVAAHNHAGEYAPWQAAVGLCLLQLFWLGATLAVFRVAGYRVV